MVEKIRNSATRRLSIQRQLLLEGTVTVEGLSHDLGVSEATIRRDLTVLESDGLVRRTHGGAMIQAARGADQAFALREQLDTSAKRTIARRALALIEPDQTLLMNDGSTILALARELVAAGVPQTVATPGVNVATYLSECPEITAYLLGGRVRHKTLATAGSFAEAMLQAINADFAFIAAEGVSATEGLTYSYEFDANLARLMRRQASTTVVLATARKLAQRDRITAFAPGDIDVLVTDCRDPETLEPLAAAGIDVISAREEDDPTHSARHLSIA